MDCDYPVPDIYDCNIVDNCPYASYFSNCQQDFSTQEQCIKNIGTDFPKEDRGCSAECKPNKRRQKLSTPLSPRKEIALLRKLSVAGDKNDVQNDLPEPADCECCPHTKELERESQRTFLLTFNNRGDDDCMSQEKSRCKAFWEFIDSEELLQAMIKDGEFFYENPPQQLNEKRVSLTRRGTAHKAALNEQQHQFMARAEKDRVIHEDENRRFVKQRQRNIELQKISGQFPVARKNQVKNISRKDDKYADTCDPSFEEIMQEMKVFDKLTKNPVRIPPDSH